MPLVYPRKIDLWLLPGIFLAAVVVFGVPARILGGTWDGAALGAGCGVSMIIALGATTWKLRYIVTDRELIAKSATFELVIPLSAIRDITPVCSIAPAPCLSVQRVRIELWHRSIMVAPVSRGSFVDELTSRCKQQGASWPPKPEQTAAT